jgi:hypothetical protein
MFTDAAMPVLVERFENGNAELASICPGAFNVATCLGLAAVFFNAAAILVAPAPLGARWQRYGRLPLRVEQILS